ncbi:MAG: hypothetical protein JF571_03790 [Asticcacaulis sp.]|nr:hypothetical protein [Asticcacaulis sp.]
MLTMAAESAALLVAAFAMFGAIGWLLAGKRRVAKRISVFDEPSVEEAAPINEPEVYQYDVAKAAEQFTSGVVVPFKMPVAPEPKAETPPAPQPQREARAPYAVDMAASRFAPSPSPQPARLDPHLRGRVSSLASMTPDSVEAAVQQAGSGLEPMRLDSPRGPVDDLTVISGIGPGNQQELNALGIYHYWQIAGWTPENVAWISNRVRFPKRIVRENWMSQAARLARLQ